MTKTKDNLIIEKQKIIDNQTEENKNKIEIEK